jgi:hypothetical protein
MLFIESKRKKEFPHKNLWKLFLLKENAGLMLLLEL